VSDRQFTPLYFHSELCVIHRLCHSSRSVIIFAQSAHIGDAQIRRNAAPINVHPKTRILYEQGRCFQEYSPLPRLRSVGIDPAGEVTEGNVSAQQEQSLDTSFHA